MEAGGNSSDSGSGGLIDVRNVSSSFNAPSLHASGDEEKKSAELSKRPCPPSVEKVWFTDTSTGVWLLNEEQTEIPDEFLDVSLESDKSIDDADSYQSQDSIGSHHQQEEDSESRDTGPAATEEVQLCSWVPPQCCLIPLPESPADSDNEGEEGEREGAEGVVGELSETQLQRQQEKELEILFGYKPPVVSDPASPAGEQGKEEWTNVGREREVFLNNDKEKVLVASHGGKRSNSTDSGVASISPHSAEGDMEQRHNQNRIETVERTTRDGEACGNSVNNSTPDRPCVSVSRLRTPSEKLRKCSVFSGSPVVCSELEELKEASKMAAMPFPPPMSFSSSSTTHDSSDTGHQTYTITPPLPTSSPSSLTTLTQHASSSPRLQHSTETSENLNNDVPVLSSQVTSKCSSTGTNKVSSTNINGEKAAKAKPRFGKAVCRNTFGYKAGTCAPLVKVTRRPPSKLKSLFPAVGGPGLPTALPSQLKKPEFKGRKITNDKNSNNLQFQAPVSSSGTQMRKTSATGVVRPSRLVPPDQRRPSNNPGPGNVQKSAAQNKTFDKTFAKPGHPNPIKAVFKPATSSTTPARIKPAGVTKISNPPTPTRVRGNAKQPPDIVRLKQTVSLQTGDKSEKGLKAATTSTANLSTSIVSVCSPSLQQSTPLRQTSHANVAATRTVTVSKVVNTTVTKDSSSAVAVAQRDEGTAAIPVTPRSSVMDSTPSRRIRPKFSLSSIESDSSSTSHKPPPSTAATANNNTFTLASGHSAVESTPRSPRKKRRSFIPTPARRAVREVVPLVYSTDSKSTQHQVQQDSPVSRKLPSNKLDKETAAVGEGERRGERRKTFLARPKPIRPLVSRNRLTTGLGKKKPPQKGPEGPLRPTYSAYDQGSFCENTEPPVSAAKMANSPVNKEEEPPSPHSAWSPIRRRPVPEGEAIYQCTKRGYRN